MSVLLHVSDTHFGTEQPPVVAALQRLSERLEPDVLVVSGDVTQRARRRQFETAGRTLGALRARRRLVIPGNHDIPLFNLAARLADPYRGWRRTFGPEIAPQVDEPEMLVVAAQTTRRWRHVNGQVSRRQIDAIARRLLAARPGQLRVVVTHQPVHVPRREDRHDLLRNHRAAIRSWSAAGADLILGGHIHLPYVLPLTPDPHPTWIVQAGTAVSSRLRRGAPNSVNVIRYDRAARRCRVERWDCVGAEAGAEFTPGYSTEIRLRPD
ncbi:MAG: metallophosphoesterase [Steroidobacteraceae bacterium]|jgi:3',5'-cyclic AMP phosphodiesterase CpdA|nr:metallophosphoesterase [Steroidobacteraceae bacterium]